MSRAIRRPSPRARSVVARALLVTAIVLTSAACQLRTEVNITVEADGSGVVEIVIALDEDGVAENPGLLEGLDFRDLRDTGWTVSEPEEEADGFTAVRVRHEFGAPEEVAVLLDEVAGENGPFRDFSVVREDGFARTTYRFDGVVDFTAGVEGLTDDPELAEALEAEPVELIEERLGGAIDQILRFQIAVRLPGDVESNAPTKASNGAVWRPSVLEQESVDLEASSTLRRTDRLVWAGVAVAAGFALVLFLLVRFVLWRRSRSTSPDS